MALCTEILTYSRSHGLFAGVSPEGSTLRPDRDNERLENARAVLEEGDGPAAVTAAEAEGKFHN